MPLLTREDLRAHGIDGDDAVLDDWIAGAETAINMRHGVPGESVSEYITAHGDLLPLSRQATGIDSVTEGTTAMDSEGYELRGDILRRVGGRWRGRVDVSYTPVDDTPERKRVALDLIKLVVNNNPGVTSETIGSWTEAYNQQNEAYQREREAILDSLYPPFRGIW